jgi:hypothetical protein
MLTPIATCNHPEWAAVAVAERYRGALCSNAGYFSPLSFGLCGVISNVQPTCCHILYQPLPNLQREHGTSNDTENSKRRVELLQHVLEVCTPRPKGSLGRALTFLGVCNSVYIGCMLYIQSSWHLEGGSYSHFTDEEIKIQPSKLFLVISTELGSKSGWFHTPHYFVLLSSIKGALLGD